MKINYLVFEIAFVSLIILLVTANSGCKNPEEYAPPVDSLIPPPAAPQLLYPPLDTSYWFGQGDQGWQFVVVVLEWTPVEDVQHYEIELASTAAFGSSILSEIKTTSTRTTALIYRSMLQGTELKVYWRVRGESSRWTWFTDWSEIWYFRARWPI